MPMGCIGADPSESLRTESVTLGLADGTMQSYKYGGEDRILRKMVNGRPVFGAPLREGRVYSGIRIRFEGHS